MGAARTKAPARLTEFDNAKAVLIGLVVAGHLIEPWIDQSHAAQIAYFAIYHVHMPAFALLAGAFSGRSASVGKTTLRLIWLYALTQIMWSAQIFAATGGPVSVPMVHPSYASWFLLALPIWILLTNAALAPAKQTSKTPPPRAVLIVLFCLILSISAGLTDAIGRAFSLSRVIVLFPFFVAGAILGVTGLKRYVPNKPRLAFCGLLLSCGVAATLVGVDNSQTVLWAKVNYQQYTSVLNGMWMRLVFIISAAVSSLCLFALVPSTPSILTQIGRASLQVYVCHIGIVIALRLYYPSASTLSANALIVSAALWVFCLVVFSHRSFLRGTDWLFDFPTFVLTKTKRT